MSNNDPKQRAPRIGHQQRRILQALYDHACKNTVDWISRTDLLWQLEIYSHSGEVSFSRAIKRLYEPRDGWNQLPPYVERGSEFDCEQAYIEAERKLTEDDWDLLFNRRRDERRKYYRITEIGIETVDNFSTRSRRKPRSKPARPGPGAPRRHGDSDYPAPQETETYVEEHNL